MAVNAWILGGAVISDCINETSGGCWRRPDLVSVPSVLQYEDVHDTETDIHFYANNIGIIIALIPYGRFDSAENMLKDFYSPNSQKYKKQYAIAVSRINKRFRANIKDYDWVMPLMIGNFEVHQNYCKLESVCSETREFVGLIDCSIIYTITHLVSSFLDTVCKQKTLSKYKRWQLIYYQRILQMIRTPNTFLINKTEIDIYTKLYDVWRIDESLKVNAENTTDAVALFTFVSNAETNEDNALFSYFLTFFGIVVGLEAIYNLFTVLFKNITYTFRLIFIVLLAIIVLIFAVVFIKTVIRRLMDKREFAHKTKKGGT